MAGSPVYTVMAQPGHGVGGKVAAVMGHGQFGGAGQERADLSADTHARILSLFFFTYQLT